MRKESIIIIVMLIVILSGCINHVSSELSIGKDEGINSATSLPITPTITPKVIPTTSPTMQQSIVPSFLPTVTPLPQATPSDNKNELPPELGEKTQNFPTDIMPFAHISQPENSEYKNPQIYIQMAYRNGKWYELSELSYGNPPIPALKYIDYLWNKYNDEQPDLNYVDLDDYFFESEVLNRDMVFYVYNGSSYIGTGRIAKKPEFMTWHAEVEISAEFKMDDPSIKLDADKEYVGFVKQWNPYPRNAVWNTDKTKFTLDIDGKGTMVSGKIYEAPVEQGSDQLWVYIDIMFKGEVEKCDLGYGTMNNQNYFKNINFCDFDGDGVIEVKIIDEQPNGESIVILSFAENKPKCIYSRSYSY